MKQDYSTFDIQKALKIPRERFRQWLDEGYITPSVPAQGAGTRASFTRMDIYRVALLDYLISRGLKRSTAALVTRGLTEDHITSKYILVRREFGHPPRISFVALSSPLWSVDLDKGTFYQTDANDPSDSSFKPAREWSDIFIINFAQIKAKVDHHIDG